MRKVLLKTDFGQLIFDTDCNELRKIAFKDTALTVSGTVIKEIYYSQQEPQIILLSQLPFESYLLSGAHCFRREDAKKFVNEFGITNISSFFVSFFPIDSPIWFAVSSSDSDKKTFELAIWDGEVDYIDECESWNIKVEADESVLVKALEYACRVAENIHTGRIQQFITKMNFLMKP